LNNIHCHEEFLDKRGLLLNQDDAHDFSTNYDDSEFMDPEIQSVINTSPLDENEDRILTDIIQHEKKS